MQEELATGQVFFSTNIAETSLTFGRLAYVIDTGKKKVPSWGNNILKLTDESAPRSTLRQRMGRCGRTREGTYVPLYQDELEDKANKARDDFAKPELLTGDALPAEFQLLCADLQHAIPRGVMKGGASMLSKLRHILPMEERNKEDLDKQIKQVEHTMEELTMVDKGGKLNEDGKMMACMPEVGGVRWRRVLAQGVKMRIGESVLMLCAAYKALDNDKSWVFSDLIPNRLKNPTDGDLCSLFNLIREAWSKSEEDQDARLKKGQARNVREVGPSLKNFIRECRSPHGKRMIRKMVREYDSMRSGFVRQCTHATAQEQNFLRKALASREAKPDEMLQALLYGFPDRVAISQKKVGGSSDKYTLLYKQSASETGGHYKQHLASIHNKSLMNNRKNPTEYVFAVGLAHLSVSDDAPELLGDGVNRCAEEWLQKADLPDCTTYADVHEKELAKVKGSTDGWLFSSQVKGPKGVQFFNSEKFGKDMLLYKLAGKPGKVAGALKFLAEELLVECKAGLFPPERAVYDLETLKRNLQEYQANIKDGKLVFNSGPIIG
jgi:HrpA-like RNA helicase